MKKKKNNHHASPSSSYARKIAHDDPYPAVARNVRHHDAPASVSESLLTRIITAGLKLAIFANGAVAPYIVLTHYSKPSLYYASISVVCCLGVLITHSSGRKILNYIGRIKDVFKKTKDD